jgi:hypothetical protein
MSFILLGRRDFANRAAVFPRYVRSRDCSPNQADAGARCNLEYASGRSRREPVHQVCCERLEDQGNEIPLVNLRKRANEGSIGFGLFMALAPHRFHWALRPSPVGENRWLRAASVCRARRVSHDNMLVRRLDARENESAVRAAAPIRLEHRPIDLGGSSHPDHASRSAINIDKKSVARCKDLSHRVAHFWPPAPRR